MDQGGESGLHLHTGIMWLAGEEISCVVYIPGSPKDLLGDIDSDNFIES